VSACVAWCAQMNATRKKPLKINKHFRIQPDLVDKTTEFAAKWSVKETAVVETALREFHATERQGLLTK
jgi:hypothetical protein